MDIGSIIGLIIGITGVLAGYVAEEGRLMTLITYSSPFLIVLGGTIGATILQFPMSDLAKIPGAIKNVFTIKNYNEVDIINQLASLSEKARKDGLLSLEQDIENNDNEIIKKGLGLVVDGIEAEIIRDILIREVRLHENVHESTAKIFEAAGGYSPTMGVLGTVMGMISILAKISEPAELGPKISTAFLATMYGVGFANLIYLPIAGRIKARAQRETMINDLIIEGLLSIQAGENPKIIKEKLNLSLLEKINNKNGSKQAVEEEAEV